MFRKDSNPLLLLVLSNRSVATFLVTVAIAIYMPNCILLQKQDLSPAVQCPINNNSGETDNIQITSFMALHTPYYCFIILLIT